MGTRVRMACTGLGNLVGAGVGAQHGANVFGSEVSRAVLVRLMRSRPQSRNERYSGRGACLLALAGLGEAVLAANGVLTIARNALMGLSANRLSRAGSALGALRQRETSGCGEAMWQ
eukprot:c18198_g1_i1.p2 GENE.c18198_g1_i1~~c18198_g1_i1.p2  ORF type:complete len:117 (+),score=3.03 c18198_g1_i1:3-353(+)